MSLLKGIKRGKLIKNKLCTCPFFFLSLHSYLPPTYLAPYPPTHLFAHPPTNLPTYPPTYLPTHLSYPTSYSPAYLPTRYPHTHLPTYTHDLLAYLSNFALMSLVCTLRTVYLVSWLVGNLSHPLFSLQLSKLLSWLSVPDIC